MLLGSISNIATESAKLRVPCVLKRCTPVNVPSVLTCQRARVQTCLAWLRVQVPTYFARLSAYVLTCQQALRAFILTRQLGVLVHVLKGQHALSPWFMLPRDHMLTCFNSSVSSFDATFFSFTSIVVETWHTVCKI